MPTAEEELLPEERPQELTEMPEVPVPPPTLTEAVAAVVVPVVLEETELVTPTVSVEPEGSDSAARYQALPHFTVEEEAVLLSSAESGMLVEADLQLEEEVVTTVVLHSLP